MLRSATTIGSVLLAIGIAQSLSACPFCTVPRATWCERRAAAEVVALVSVDSQPSPTGATTVDYRVPSQLRGPRLAERDPALADALAAARVTGLAIVARTADAADVARWEVIRCSEASVGYWLGAPDGQRPAAARLAFFARYLEHEDPLVADDAYSEFGRAPFAAVRQTIDQISMAEVRDWLVSDNVPPERRGLYGLLLGLSASAVEQPANERALRAVIETPASDFRAGFDGVLGGYLLLTGERGLVELQGRYVSRDDAAVGDVRHFLTALRFYHEYGERIPRARLAQAVTPLVKRADVAPTVIADLARWRHWEALPIVLATVDADQPADANRERAVAAFLLVCPEPRAQAALEALRARLPERVAEAERQTLLFGGAR